MTEALALAGAYLGQHADQQLSSRKDLAPLNEKYFDAFEEAIATEHFHNAWFTEQQVRKAIATITM